jgi:hypothetical protein
MYSHAVDQEELVVMDKSPSLNKTKTKLHGLSPQANYTDRLSDRRLSAKLVPTLAYRVSRGQRNDSPTVVNFGFLDRSRYFLESAPQLSSRG